MVEMFIKQVGVNAGDGHPVVLLKERDGHRVMPIWVGLAEYRAIALALKEMIPERPQTHDLFDSVLKALDCTVTGLEICEIADGAFLAKLHVLKNAQEQLALDCRPSDGMALALRHKAPITVAPNVVEAAGYPDEPDMSKEDNAQFKEFLKNLKPSDFANLAQSKSVPDDLPGAGPETQQAGDSDHIEGIIKDNSEDTPAQE